MYTVGIFFEGKGWLEFRVDEPDAAYEAYAGACRLGPAVGATNVALWDTETSEVVADLSDEDEDLTAWEPEPEDLREAWWEG